MNLTAGAAASDCAAWVIEVLVIDRINSSPPVVMVCLDGGKDIDASNRRHPETGAEMKRSEI